VLTNVLYVVGCLRYIVWCFWHHFCDNTSLGQFDFISLSDEIEPKEANKAREDSWQGFVEIVYGTQELRL